MQCKHQDVIPLYRVRPTIQIESNRIGNYTLPPREFEYYCNNCGRKSKEPFGNLFVSPTGSTQTDFVSEVSTTNKKMNTEEFLKNLNRVKGTVNKKKTEGQQLLEALRKKGQMNEQERNEIVDRITNKIDNDLMKRFKSVEDALINTSKKLERLPNIDSKITTSLKNAYTKKFNVDSEKKKENVNIPPIAKATLLVKTLYFRPTFDSKEIDGVKHIDIGFSQPLDIDSEKLDFFGNNVKIVEWADVPKKLFGFKSKIFGVKKDVKTLRITEEELIKRYEHTMGSKIS